MRLTALVASLALVACSAADGQSPDTPSPAEMETGSVYDLTLTTIDNRALPLDQFAGRPILLVNTASKCGFTRQYDGLQALHETYGDRGLVVLGVPSDNFGGQEYAANDEIAEFCKLNFGVTFPLATRSDVVGPDRLDLFARAEDALGESAVPKWNFHKILIDGSGQPVAAFGSNTEPMDSELTAAIERLL